MNKLYCILCFLVFLLSLVAHPNFAFLEGSKEGPQESSKLNRGLLIDLNHPAPNWEEETSHSIQPNVVSKSVVELTKKEAERKVKKRKSQKEYLARLYNDSLRKKEYLKKHQKYQKIYREERKTNMTEDQREVERQKRRTRYQRRKDSVYGGSSSKLESERVRIRTLVREGKATTKDVQFLSTIREKDRKRRQRQVKSKLRPSVLQNKNDSPFHE